jgi:hypothetical protein
MARIPQLILILLTATPACGFFKSRTFSGAPVTPSPTPVAALSEVVPDDLSSTSETSKDLNFTYFDMRVGNTPQARKDALESLRSVSETPSKLAYASQYITSLEFQFWKPSVDTSDHREELFELSVRDLFKVTRSLVESSDGQDLKSEISTLQDLNAIAATLHFVNLAQSGALRALPGTPEITLVDLLERGLKAKDLLDSGKMDESELKGFEREVIHNEALAVYLLRSRQNFLKSLAFLLMSPQAQTSKSKPGITLKKEDLLEQSWLLLQDPQVHRCDSITICALLHVQKTVLSLKPAFSLNYLKRVMNQ